MSSPGDAPADGAAPVALAASTPSLAAESAPPRTAAADDEAAPPPGGPMQSSVCMDPPADGDVPVGAAAGAGGGAGAGAGAGDESLTTGGDDGDVLHPITHWRTAVCKASRYIRPISVLYKQGPVDRRWDVVQGFDGVGILIYHRDKHAFVLVRQFRAAVHLVNLQRASRASKPMPSPRDAFTYELCAGLVDKPESVQQIAKEEVMEECGYDVEVEDLEMVKSIRGNVGLIGNIMTYFYVEVGEEQHTGPGGGLEDEDIEVLTIPVADAEDLLRPNGRPMSSSLTYLLEWWLRRKLPAVAARRAEEARCAQAVERARAASLVVLEDEDPASALGDGGTTPSKTAFQESYTRLLLHSAVVAGVVAVTVLAGAWWSRSGAKSALRR